MKIMKKSLSEQIYSILKQEILTHKIEFGSTLVNRDLQERFNVSSTPIRDAVLRLKEDGIIETVTRSGAKLINFDYDFAIKVNQVILILTLGALESTKDKSNPELIAALKNNLYLEEENVNTDLYYNYDYNFHKTIFDFCDNYLLKDIFKKYNLILQLLTRYYHDLSFENKIRKKCIEQHSIILDALENGDFELVTKLIKAHYEEAETFFRKANEHYLQNKKPLK